jgi:hypothetical protein
LQYYGGIRQCKCIAVNLNVIEMNSIEGSNVLTGFCTAGEEEEEGGLEQRHRKSFRVFLMAHMD